MDWDSRRSDCTLYERGLGARQRASRWAARLSSVKVHGRTLEASFSCSANGLIDVTRRGARRTGTARRYRCREGRATVIRRLSRRPIRSGRLGDEVRLRIRESGTAPVSATLDLPRPSRRPVARAAAWGTWDYLDAMAVCWTNRQLSVTAKYQSRFGVPFGQAFWWKSMLQLYTTHQDIRVEIRIDVVCPDLRHVLVRTDGHVDSGARNLGNRGDSVLRIRLELRADELHVGQPVVLLRLTSISDD